MSIIIIQLHGGLVADTSLQGEGIPNKVVVVDEDIESADEEEITRVIVAPEDTYEACVHAEKIHKLPADSAMAKMVKAYLNKGKS